jgi:hypothetical protein
MDLNEIEDIAILRLTEQLEQPRRMRTDQSGQDYIQELLDSGHPERVYQVLRLQQATLYALRDWLRSNAELKDGQIRGPVLLLDLL